LDEKTERRKRRAKAKEAKASAAGYVIHPAVIISAYLLLIVGFIWAFMKYSSTSGEAGKEIQESDRKQKKHGKKSN
jgi:flagellar biogenesis protein FliO